MEVPWFLAFLSAALRITTRSIYFECTFFDGSAFRENPAERGKELDNVHSDLEYGERYARASTPSASHSRRTCSANSNIRVVLVSSG